MLSRTLPALIDPIRQSQGHGAISLFGLIRAAFAVRGAPRRPLRPSGLSLPHLPNVPPTLPRRGHRTVPLCECAGSRLPRLDIESSPSSLSLSAILDRSWFRGCICSLYAAARWFASPSWLSPEDFVTPASGAVPHETALGVRLDRRTGNLRSRDFHPISVSS